MLHYEILVSVMVDLSCEPRSIDYMTLPPPHSSKQEKKRARAEEKQRKRQERARRKRVARRHQQKCVEAALRPIGATITKRRPTATSSRKSYVVTWYDEEFCFEK